MKQCRIKATKENSREWFENGRFIEEKSVNVSWMTIFSIRMAQQLADEIDQQILKELTNDRI